MKLRHLRKMLKNHQGFTLTEMLIVIALIGIVGTLVIQNLTAQFNKGKIDSTKIQIRQLGLVLEDFKRDCNIYPTTEQGLDALLAKPTGGKDCPNYNTEGYVKGKKVPKDAWGNDFIYESDGAKFVIKSLGPTGKEGGKVISSEELD